MLIDLTLLAFCVFLGGVAGWVVWSARTGDALPEDEFSGKDSRPSLMARFEVILDRLGLPMDPMLFLSGTTALVVGSFFVFQTIFSDRLSLSAVASLGMLVLAFMLANEFLSRASRKVDARMLDAMDLMNSALRGGMPPRQALSAAADSLEGILKSEIEEIVRRLDLGLSIEQAVSRMRRRYRVESVRLFTQALVAKWHSGSDFSELMNAVADLTRERLKLRQQVSGQLSGARYAALFSGALPYLLVPVIMWRQPDWFDAFSTHPHGLSILVFAIMLQVFGFIWLNRTLRGKI